MRCRSRDRKRLANVPMTRKPSGIDGRPDQLRPAIIKGDSVTDFERYLANLAEKSFLNLWSYPSPYRDQKQDGKGDGKELCDLLVVCGRHIIIFSEKRVAWPTGTLETAWCRWAKKAVRDAARQAGGAERWITEFPTGYFWTGTVPSPSQSTSPRLMRGWCIGLWWLEGPPKPAGIMFRAAREA